VRIDTWRTQYEIELFSLGISLRCVKKLGFAALASVVSGVLSLSALAATEIEWWHAMGGALGERVNEIAENFNRSQSDYKLIAVYKGNYSETMTAGIAAFRSGKQPEILQVFEVGTASGLSERRCRLLHHDRRQDAVHAIQQFHAGSVVEQGSLQEGGTRSRGAAENLA
jgi:hypothetical protein